jgi:riboflavin synthase
MFTGLVQAKGEVTHIESSETSAVFKIRAPKLVRKIRKGDSVSVNGVCLTAIKVSGKSFSADVMVQTLKMTSLATLKEGVDVNLELAAKVSDRLGGHIVQGHVDGVGEVVLVQPGDKWVQMDITVPEHLLKYMQNQGSITVDGVSLTIGTVDDSKSQVTVWLIPETLAATNLGMAIISTRVNIEVDVLAKYVERIMERRTHE